MKHVRKSGGTPSASVGTRALEGPERGWGARERTQSCVFTLLKASGQHPRISCTVEIPSEKEGQIKVFSDRQNLRLSSANLH